jgi:hypothetical protein
MSLTIDGPRPAYAWVTSLPRAWLSDAERLVLLVLAADAYEDDSAPGGDALVAATGLLRGRVYRALASLQQPTPERPALIQKSGVRSHRAVYRLLTMNSPTSQDSSDVHGEETNSRVLPKRRGAGPVRRKLIHVPARIASSARRITLHLPEAWPWHKTWTRLFDRVADPPATAPS